MEHSQEDFAPFVEAIEGRLRAALVARYGPETGRDATADALGWAWRNWDRLADMERPLGYLYRVGQSNARRYRHRTWPLDAEPKGNDQPKVYDRPMVEPRLHACLLELTERQRVAVVLVYGLEWSYQEVADLLGIKATSVQNHLHRGLAKLNERLGEPDAKPTAG